MYKSMQWEAPPTFSLVRIPKQLGDIELHKPVV